MYLMDISFTGTTADWVAAIATAGALVAAIGAGLQANKLYRIESRRDAVARRARSREQASKVNAWSVIKVNPGVANTFGVVVANSSTDPVYDVSIEVHNYSTTEVPTLACVPPGSYFLEDCKSKGAGRSSNWTYAAAVDECDEPLRPFTASENKKVTSVRFTDSSGRAWKREKNGTLTVIRSETEAVSVS